LRNVPDVTSWAWKLGVVEVAAPEVVS